jgi:transcriptional regulator with XRE-family HTH domain
MENSRFPNRLKRYRRIFFLSQQEVATLLGLKDTSPLSKWEKGVSFPNLMHLFRLCRIYKTLPSELYVELWHSISKEMAAKEVDLLAHQESLTNNQIFYL